MNKNTHFPILNENNDAFHRAMLGYTKRGYATKCRPFVRLSGCRWG